jgi:hypothetical protein
MKLGLIRGLWILWKWSRVESGNWGIKDWAVRDLEGAGLIGFESLDVLKQLGK